MSDQKICIFPAIPSESLFHILMNKENIQETSKFQAIQRISLENTEENIYQGIYQYIYKPNGFQWLFNFVSPSILAKLLEIENHCTFHTKEHWIEFYISSGNVYKVKGRINFTFFEHECHGEIIIKYLHIKMIPRFFVKKIVQQVLIEIESDIRELIENF
jgi:hypothetical protein